MYTRRTMLAATGIALALATAGCSSDNPTARPNAANDTIANGEDLSSVPGATEDSPATEGGATPTIDPSDSCHVDITGDVNVSWDSPGGYSAVGYGPWIPSTPGNSVPIALDETFFILNCTGPGESYVGFGAATDARIPMTPGVYPILPSDNVLGGSGSPHMIQALLGIDGTDTNWGPSAEGSLTITAFDGDHIAGTFLIPVTDVLADITGASKGDAVISGTFNFVNPNP